MANLECPNCGSALANEAAVCRECGKEVSFDQNSAVSQTKGPHRKNISAILAVFFAVAGGVSLLMFTGLLPNPMKGALTAAIVNGEKISMADVDQKFELYQKRSGKSGQKDLSTSEGKAAAADAKMQILHTMIQERILVIEATKEKISATPQEIADKMNAVKKSLNFSDQDFDGFLQQHGMTLANFEKRMEKDVLIEKLIDKVTKEKGLTKDAWLADLNNRAKVEILAK